MRYRWFADEKYKETVDQENKPPKKRRAPIAGAFLSLCVLLYGLISADIPIMFVALAFLLQAARPYLSYFGDKGKWLGHFFHGLSITLFAGAMVMIFL